jgi:hypothetical protein
MTLVQTMRRQGRRLGQRMRRHRTRLRRGVLILPVVPRTRRSRQPATAGNVPTRRKALRLNLHLHLPLPLPRLIESMQSTASNAWRASRW